MAASNRLIVEVVGDTSKLTSSLNSAQQQINRFAGRSKIHTTGLDSDLAQIRQMEAEAKALQGATQQAAEAQTLLQSRLAGTALKASIAGATVFVVSQNLQDLGGEAGKFGNAIGQLVQGNFVGFAKAANDSSAAVNDLSARLIKAGNYTDAINKANLFAKIGFDSLATAARDAAAAIDEAKVAARTPIPFSAISGGTFGITPLDPTLGKGRNKNGGLAGGITPAQRNTFFDNDISRQLDRVQDLGLKAQVTRLGEIAAIIQKRIDVTKDITRKLNLEDQLAAVNRQRKGVQATIVGDAQAAAAAARTLRNAQEQARQQAELARRQATQFRLLGLGPDGQQIVPGAANLRKQLSSLTDRLGSSQLASKLDGARKLLSGKFGKLTEDTRKAIRDLFDTIRSEFDKGAKKLDSGSLTKTTSLNTAKILRGLGLSPEEERAVRARLSQFNSGGVGLPGGVGAFGVSINPVINLDGKKISTNTRNHNTVHAQRNPKQKRGA